MKPWKLRSLIIAGIAAAIAGITSLVLWNPIGLSVVGVVTGLLVVIFPNMPWFLPPITIWLLLFAILAILLMVSLKKSKIRLF